MLVQLFVILLSVIVANSYNSSDAKVAKTKVFFYLVDHNGKFSQINNDFPEIDPNTPVKLISHGWRGEAKIAWIRQLAKEYNKNPSYTVIAIDWSHYAKKSYENAIKSIPKCGEATAKFIKKLVNYNGIDLKDIHVIGFSLGGHIAGQTGFYVQKLMEGEKLGRITGLDSAGPRFDKKYANIRLDKSHAEFVDGIHTSKRYGIQIPYAHVDFFVNGGEKQRGCSNQACSHNRAYQYWTEGVTSKTFVACEMDPDSRLVCDNPELMGESTPSTAEGSYFLETNSKSPFGKGAT